MTSNEVFNTPNLIPTPESIRKPYVDLMGIVLFPPRNTDESAELPPYTTGLDDMIGDSPARMTPNEYQKFAARTCPIVSDKEMLTLGALGLAGETGETVEHIKKFLFHGKELKRDELKKELGDVAWYLATLCTALDFSFEDVLTENIEKLKARWPNGFKTAGEVNG